MKNQKQVDLSISMLGLRKSEHHRKIGDVKEYEVCKLGET